MGEHVEDQGWIILPRGQEQIIRPSYAKAQQMAVEQEDQHELG
jgi:hypothetical protein